jgi:hypothetical protein
MLQQVLNKESILQKTYDGLTAPVFSYYKSPVTNILPDREINLLQAYLLIRGREFAEQTTCLRSISDEAEARKFKAAHFDYVTFSGTFSQRNDQFLKKHSGLLTIDFDHLQDIEALKFSLLHDEYFETEMLFVSPSGNGLKWIIAIDLNKAPHNDWFRAISYYIRTTYRLETDKTGINISRACFLPYDPSVYINLKMLVSVSKKSFLTAERTKKTQRTPR